MIEKRRALGRGLDTLLPAVASQVAVAPASMSPSERLLELKLELIDRNPYQTRSRTDDIALAELAASIAANGVLQPIVVRATQNGRYQLIAGERRWLASKRAGKSAVPAVVRQVSSQQALEMTIVENLQREDLSPMDHARAFDRLAHEFGLTQEQIAQRTGKDRATVANYLRLLKLPATVQIEVSAGNLSFGHAKALLALGDSDLIEQLAQRVVEQGLSVRQTEELVARSEHPPQKQARTRAVDPNVRQAERSLESALGCKVEIHDRKGKGRIVIEYGSLEDFDRVLGALGSHA